MKHTNPKEAKAAGITRYFSKVCEKHPELNGERQTSNRKCVGCLKKRTNEYLEKTTSTRIKYRSDYYVKNKSNRIEYIQSNKKHIARIKLVWARKNASKINARNAKRRAAEKQATPGWFEKEKVQLVYDMANIMGFEVDHVVPLQSDIVCGLHCWYNLQVLDKPINSGKCNRHWPDMP